VEVLTGRADWAKELLAAIAAAKVPANLLNVNQVRKLLSANNPELLKLVSDQWGSLRTQRDPAREELIERMRAVVLAGPGDPLEGQKVFAKVCGQCHKIYGQGEEVGPDITQNGRSSFEQLLSNVFDPSLVIGTGYQATIVVTKDGRVLTGLLVEDSAQRVQLKIQGGKVETIPRDNVETQKLSELSLMPEGLENQLTEKEITDLFAYITLDRPPTDPAAKRLPGSVRVADQESTTPDDFTGLVAQVLPGWTLDGSGVGGVAVLSRYRGQPTVLRTHPVSRQRASQLTRQVAVPAAGHSRLSLAVSSDERGDWLLRVAIDGELAYETVVSNDAATDGWREIAVDLTPYAGKTVTITLSNEANGWDWEHGYWSRAEVITEP
jgi:putative heme-binding domain-containing protein